MQLFSRSHNVLVFLTASLVVAPSVCIAQFNIDIGGTGGTPGHEQGPPSPTFGGAANQTGFWNNAGFGGRERLRDCKGRPGPQYMDPVGFSGGFGTNLGGNTGDYWFLFNDGVGVTGNSEVTFRRLKAGIYDVYTYSMIGSSYTEVTIPNATSTASQWMTSPPANTFIQGFSHTIHRVEISNHEPLVVILRPLLGGSAAYVSGFQIVQIEDKQ